MLLVYIPQARPSPKHRLSVGRNNVEIWDTFLWVPICFHKSFKTMTQVWSCSQQVLLDYPIVLDFNTRAPNQTLLVGRNIQCEYYIVGWSFNLEKKSIWFVCIFWTLVLSCCQPTFPLESGPFEKNSRLQCDRQVALSRFHANTLFTLLEISCWFGYWLFLRLVSSVFLLWFFFQNWWICFQTMKKSMKNLRFSWRFFAIFWLKKFKLATSRPRHFLGRH